MIDGVALFFFIPAYDIFIYSREIVLPPALLLTQLIITQQSPPSPNYIYTIAR